MVDQGALIDGLLNDISALDTCSAAIMAGMNDEALDADGVYFLLQCIVSRLRQNVNALELTINNKAM